MSYPKKENVSFGKPPTRAAPPTETYPRHIQLPFDMRDPNIRFEGEVVKVLEKVFPSTTGVMLGKGYLSFIVKTLPDGPLPLTIGGLPITVSDEAGNGKGPLFPKFMCGNPSVRLCGDVDGLQIPLSGEPLRTFAQTVTTAILETCPQLPVLEIILPITKELYIVLDDSVDIAAMQIKLPGRISRLFTAYLNNKDLGRPSKKQAYRGILPDPSQRVVDNTPYEVLRPGIQIFSLQSTDPEVGFYTTSGVLVESHAGRFMTAASDGIGQNEQIFQKLPQGGRRLIGKPVHEITCTDVAIVKLEDGLQFKNEAFQQAGENYPDFKRLVGEQDRDIIQAHTIVNLNSPYTGSITGTVAAAGWRVISGPSELTTQRNLRYTLYEWIYVGQNNITIPESVCGSAIWDDDGRIIGFFHFYIAEGAFKGLYASVSAEEVVLNGYKLARD